ncbi:phospholipid methyltransferase [Methylobacterium currus]|uniref:class I SAM-dependent methyltransferase n=1 Tax=Methylobacterium currus TaxID=2051553 RepID=UPI001580CCDE|nr:rRNA adenine N-6-methyltransferase family protein [Methylobacterium currus]UHC15810.1 phospholipid methyltransferase [Methylobacterium currus]
MPLPHRSRAKAVAVSSPLPHPKPQKKRDILEDEARFLRSWFERPLVTGAVTPSGRMLARTMASYVDPRLSGPVIELGPGTGPVTDALVRRGIAPERLVLVEYNPDFCKLLRRRFPKATVLQGDAYDIRATLAGVVAEPASATISSLPLFTKPLEQRLDLLTAAHDLMHADAPFVQFTYAVVPPIPAKSTTYTASRSNKVWLNLPPARVWVYRRP